jgi:hypothetical protein
MGVDAIIVASKAKRFFYFDRVYNFVSYSKEHDEDPVYAEALKHYELKLTRSHVLHMACKNIEAWSVRPEDNHRVQYNRNIIKFANSVGTDEEFYVITDHDSPNFHDAIRTLGLVEWIPETIKADQLEKPTGPDLMRLYLGLVGILAGAALLLALYLLAFHWIVDR